ncbi:MAG: hypothetical protein ACO1N9_11390 [Flavobacterium sp.]
MELKRIEYLLERYFEAETSIKEEKQLKAYFSGADVAPHLQQYGPMFGYYTQAATQQFDKALPLKPRKQYVAWLSVAASVVVMLGVATFMYNQPQEQDLGTYNDPEVAFRETQKALNMLSENVNTGMGSLEYLNEYEKSKQTIFK